MKWKSVRNPDTLPAHTMIQLLEFEKPIAEMERELEKLRAKSDS